MYQDLSFMKVPLPEDVRLRRPQRSVDIGGRREGCRRGNDLAPGGWHCL